MSWIVKLLSESQKDFEKLDGSVKKSVLKKLVKLESNPYYGDVLGNKAGIDLTGYYKMYADDKRIRIVYKVIASEVHIIAIDKREDLEVYKLAFQRIHSQ